MPFGLPAVLAFLHGPPLLGKILENKEAGEAGVRTGKESQLRLASVGGAENQSQCMVCPRSWCW